MSVKTKAKCWTASTISLQKIVNTLWGFIFYCLGSEGKVSQLWYHHLWLHIRSLCLHPCYSDLCTHTLCRTGFVNKMKELYKYSRIVCKRETKFHYNIFEAILHRKNGDSIINAVLSKIFRHKWHNDSKGNEQIIDLLPLQNYLGKSWPVLHLKSNILSSTKTGHILKFVMVIYHGLFYKSTISQ
jgi:hypothetical protein